MRGKTKGASSKRPSDLSVPIRSPGLVNGSAAPPPIDLALGKTYRLRLININPDWRVIFSLMSDSALVKWRPVAKDGADLLPTQRDLRSGYWLTGPGNVGTLDPDGAVRLELELSDQVTFEARTFFTQTSGYSEGHFDRDAVPITFTASGPVTQVFREGSASAPVFATCTQTQSISGTRTGE